MSFDLILASPAQGPTHDSLHGPGLQVHHHTPGHVALPPRSLIKEHIGLVQLPGLIVTKIISSRTDPMLSRSSQFLLLNLNSVDILGQANVGYLYG